jgi:NADH-quinone oxidoreductase subunit K
MLRQQLLAMVLGLEMMINSANVAIVYYALRYHDARGLAVALIVIALAAAEVVVGISLILALNRKGEITETDQVQRLSG